MAITAEAVEFKLMMGYTQAGQSGKSAVKVGIERRLDIYHGTATLAMEVGVRTALAFITVTLVFYLKLVDEPHFLKYLEITVDCTFTDGRYFAAYLLIKGVSRGVNSTTAKNIQQSLSLNSMSSFHY